MVVKVYGYCRVSTFEQLIGLDAQRAAIQREHDYRFKGKDGYEWGGFFIDQGVSGKTPLRQRPEGARMALTLTKGDVLIISKLDRGFRSSIDLGECIDYFENKGVGLVLCDLGIDPMTVIGKMMLRILVAVAEFEREMISLRTREALAARKAAGLTTPKATYGFRLVGKTGKKHLIPDSTSRAWGQKFLEWHLAGWSENRIWSYCLEQRYFQPGGKEWTVSKIHRWILAEKKLLFMEQQRRDEQEAKKSCTGSCKEVQSVHAPDTGGHNADGEESTSETAPD